MFFGRRRRGRRITTQTLIVRVTIAALAIMAVSALMRVGDGASPESSPPSATSPAASSGSGAPEGG